MRRNEWMKNRKWTKHWSKGNIERQKRELEKEKEKEIEKEREDGREKQIKGK